MHQHPRSLPFPPLMAALALLASCTPILHSPKVTDTDSGLDTGPSWVAPENTWPSAAPPEGLEGTSFGQGGIPPDFRLKDQFGDTVSLYQFYGMVIALDFSTGWCGPCADLARGVEELYQEFKDQGLMYLTVMPENGQGDVPSRADLEQWASAFDLTCPVLSDGDGYTAQAVPTALYPKILIIDRTMHIVNANVTPQTDAAIHDAIADAL